TLFEYQDDQDTQLRVLRLSSHTAWGKRIKEAKKFIRSVNPNWISLQFVPFSFHKKGLPFMLANQLKEMIETRELHIMFHELWIGINGKVSLKQRTVGMLQKILVKTLIAQLTPKVITTSIAAYQEALKGHVTQVLPLFG